jgi:predicted nucleic acid-binding protein
VKVYIDTNLVVARTMAEHVHHTSATVLFGKIQQQRWIPVISSHGLAEIYTALTGTPFQHRPTPIVVWQMLNENLLKLFEVQALGRKDYMQVIQDCAARGLTGARIYDALHIHSARKAGCRRIYTFNAKHFRALAPDLQDQILVP